MNGIWLTIGNEPLEKTKRFARALFEADLTGKIISLHNRAGRIDCEDDPEKALDTYFANMTRTENIVTRYIVGREEEVLDKNPGITLFLRNLFEGEYLIYRLVCPLHENQQKVEKIFKEVYGMSMFAYERMPS